MHASLTAVSTALLFVSCQTVHPADMTIDEHKAAAAAERENAKADAARYSKEADTIAMTMPSSTNATAEPTYVTYNPTQRYLDAAAQHERLAKAHERAAAKLAAFEDQACKPFSAAVRAACPVLGAINRIQPLTDGARVELVNVAEADAVAQHIRCHIAFGDAHGEDAVDGCPLYIKGLKVKAKDGALLFTTTSASDTAKLNAMLAEHVTGRSAAR